MRGGHHDASITTSVSILADQAVRPNYLLILTNGWARDGGLMAWIITVVALFDKLYPS